ncbi:MAG TPA: hypothetical protein VIM19_12255 [Actinomycetes bacterium]
MSLTGLRHQALDESYVLVDTTWTGERSGSAPSTVALASSLILHRRESGLRIVFYLNHQDMGLVLGDGASRQRP